MVEKIKRDVRITTIYEGTSEIMEWTIARDRWQLHLKSRGQYYLDWAARAESRHAQSPNVGAGHAALALRGLAALLERARLDRLTRNQHVLFRLGELIAYAETAALFSERAASAPSGASGLEPKTLEAMARVHAREAVLKVASDGLRWAVGAGQTDPGLKQQLCLDGAMAAQAGLVEDMDGVAADLNRAFPAK
jgi:alkylation response protein AidB-like acyl-CoA dehydrogenase